MCRVPAGVEPCDIAIRKLVETSHRTCREVRVRHFVRQRPGGGRDEQGAIHWLTNLSKVDELPGRQRYHVCAFVRSTSSLTQSLVEIRSMLTRRDPNLRAMVFCVQCGCASNLAH